jgi:FdhD protein
VIGIKKNPTIRDVAVVRHQRDGPVSKTERVATEQTLSIRVNDRKLLALQCLPAQQEELALGFLYAEGLIEGINDVRDMRVDSADGTVVIDFRLELDEGKLDDFVDSMSSGSGCGGAPFSSDPVDIMDCRRKIDHSFRVEGETLMSLVHEFQQSSDLFKETGAVHSAAVLARNSGGWDTIVFAEDIGRHNAVDKAIGAGLKMGQEFGDKILLCSGRLSLEIATKAARSNFPLLASPAAPTNAAIQQADAVMLTLVGFVRGSRMNIYCADWRVT